MTRPLFGPTDVWLRRANFTKSTPSKWNGPLQPSLLLSSATRPTSPICLTVRRTPAGPHADSQESQNEPPSRIIEHRVLPLSEPRRLRDRGHVKLVSKQPCLICGRRPCDAHHLRFAQRRALGRKVSDEFTVPLCRGHHRELHRCGDEMRWWKGLGIDPLPTARQLWLKTHPITNVTAAIETAALSAGSDATL